MNPLPLLLLCAAVAGALATAFGLGHAAGTDACQAAQTARVAQARAADVAALQAAQTHGDALTAQLQATQTTLTQKNQEIRHALATQTTGRACLSGTVVRLLNSPATGGPASVPTPATSAAAADGGAASDTDVAEWASNARTQFDTCRARLDALIDWQ